MQVPRIFSRHLLVAAAVILLAAVVGLAVRGVATSLAGWLVSAVLAGLATVGIGFGWRFHRRRKTACRQDADHTERDVATHEAPADGPRRDPTGNLVASMLQQGRYALLLRPQLAKNLDSTSLARTQAQFRRSMSLVPRGEVMLERWQYGDQADGGGEAAGAGRLVRIDATYLDRYTVTNAQFQAFVDQQGYETCSCWHPAIRARVKELVDQSGRPGPRFWVDGCFPAGEADFPVVGINWYEADAYARWVGKRLPTDAEWVKAACCPAATQRGSTVQRRFPWGDVMDVQKANLWNSRLGRVAAVHEFSAGASAGGVYQLCGNVWEWTASDFQVWMETENIQLDRHFKSLRGGAYDSYFENQATCQLQSGDSPLARKHNIGFRCAIGAGDLISLGEPQESADGVGEYESEPSSGELAAVVEAGA